MEALLPLNSQHVVPITIQLSNRSQSVPLWTICDSLTSLKTLISDQCYCESKAPHDHGPHAAVDGETFCVARSDKQKESRAHPPRISYYPGIFSILRSYGISRVFILS